VREFRGYELGGEMVQTNVVAAVAPEADVAVTVTVVSRVLTQMFAFGLFDKAPSGSTTATVTTAVHAQVALQGAEEGSSIGIVRPEARRNTWRSRRAWAAERMASPGRGAGEVRDLI
jgi:hypothetical protein